MEENKNVKKVERVVEVRKGEDLTPVAGSATPSVVAYTPAPRKKYSETVKTIRQTCIWFNIITAMLCAIISLINIWSDNSLNDIMGKSWATFLVLGAFSMFIMVLAPLLDKDTQ